MAGNFTTLLTNVDTALNNFAFKTYASLSTEFTTTVKIVFILYWVIYGLMIIQGWIEFHINECNYSDPLTIGSLGTATPTR